MKPPMSLITRACAILVSGIGVGLLVYAIKPTVQSIRLFAKPTPTTTWHETVSPLTEIEQATMGANFQQEFEQAIQKGSATPTLPPIMRLDVPASMAGDLTSPTVTIQGGPAEGGTIFSTSVCFPLWVSDNMTPWQQLSTRAVLDTRQWSLWMNTFSYCFDNLGGGVHTFTVQIRDLAGNISGEVKRVFIVKQ